MCCHTGIWDGWLLLKTVLILVPLPSHDCTRMSLLNPNLHALTVFDLAGSHSLIPLPPPFLKSVLLLFSPLHTLFISPCIPSVHPSIPSFISSFSPCLAQQCAVEKQIACILSLCVSLHLCHKSWIKSWIKGTISGFYVHPWHHYLQMPELF